MLNKVTLIGRLGNDPDLRYMPDGGRIATISLATSRRWKDKNTDEKREETEWHRVVFFGRVAEVVETYLRKSSLIYVEGRIQTKKWQDEGGQDRYSTQIVGGLMQMLGSRDQSQSASSVSQKTATLPPSANPNVPPLASDAPIGVDDFDDIPF